MKYYFELQYLRLKRHFKESGINPFLGILLSILMFALLTLFLFIRTKYAPYLFALLSISGFGFVNTKNHVDFLKLTFSKKIFRNIRLIENLFIATIFTLILLITKNYFLGIGVLVLGILSGYTDKQKNVQLNLPTPFGKYPFEFTIGFRNYFYLYLISYFLTFMSVKVINPNLGIFALISPFLISMLFYINYEPEHFIWIHSMSSQKFLFHKLMIAIRSSLLIAIPIIVAMLVFFPIKFFLIFTFPILGILYIFLSILGKYAFYPAEVNIIAGLAITGCIIFPPLMILVIPFFYKRAIQNLEHLL